MKKNKIWIVSEVFYPDTDIATANIATEIALKFRERFEVHVICGPKDYERVSSNTRDNLEGIVIHRWNYFNLDKNHSIKRLIRVIGLSFGLFFKSFAIKKEDKVFVISNPAFITPLYALLKKIKRFNYYLLMHDVFPENLIAGGYISSKNIVYRIMRRFFIRSRNVADKIIVIGRDMRNLLLEHFPQSRKDDIVIIPNWADTETVYPIKTGNSNPAVEPGQKITILFAGNHGILQNLLDFIKLTARVNNPQLHYIFAGGGATKKDLERYVSENGIQNITFLPPFPRKDINKTLNACDIGLVSLSDQLYGVGVPSKSYNILAAGKPILFVGNTETEIPRFITENKVGWAFSYSDPEKLVAFLNQLQVGSIPYLRALGEKGRAAVGTFYSKENILEQLLHLVSRTTVSTVKMSHPITHPV
ncbi:glycosyltransferase family 4 protein [Niabella pedocola]|uniref:Glycosyltransferase family 4 protein n=2 Tax=Niabella pedocola TaxID=1752077 RepID=A0ABS8PK63_9BACT|nr:glycosyltransferase family 4 protein [Niabella pedocola]MCD2421381.1 glycosyltransferase family 4 protein [Niabella pedocola]